MKSAVVTPVKSAVVTPVAGQRKLARSDLFTMIDISQQWRAAIGHWNSSGLRSLTLATDIDAESLRESTNETFIAASTIKPTDNPTATYTAAVTVTHISAVCSGPDSTPNRIAEVSTKETVPICKGMLSCDTVSYAVYLLLYLMLLLLLSGDIELNPGPITVEQGIKKTTVY